jgi:hypothetical protein
VVTMTQGEAICNKAGGKDKVSSKLERMRLVYSGEKCRCISI